MTNCSMKNGKKCVTIMKADKISNCDMLFRLNFFLLTSHYAPLSVVSITKTPNKIQ